MVKKSKEVAKKAGKFASNFYLVLIFLFLYAPIVVMLVYSFTNARSLGVWKGFSFQPYIDIFAGNHSEKILGALQNSLILAVVAAVISTILGTFAAIGIYNMKKLPRRILNGVNQLPMINAEVVTAVGLLVLFAAIPFIKMGWTTLIIGHVSFCTPYVILSVYPALISMDPNIYEAALDLGSTPTKALWKVVMPILRSGIISGFIMAFTISLDDFTISLFTHGGVETLSTYIWNNSVKKGVEPAIKALSTLIFVAVLAVLLAVNIYKLRQEKKKRKGA